eukprot:scaffold12922_cov39-Phaeocystis_antarctica.AAC.2
MRRLPLAEPHDASVGDLLLHAASQRARLCREVRGQGLGLGLGLGLYLLLYAAAQRARLCRKVRARARARVRVGDLLLYAASQRARL